jgi:hypothetical protein
MSPVIQVTQEEYSSITFLTDEANRLRVSFTEGLSRRGHCAFRVVQTSSLVGISATDIRLLDAAPVSRLLNQRSSANDGVAAITLLQRLEDLSPAVAANFMLKEGGIDGLRFRLYNDRGLGETVEESYIALSYRWKSQVSNDSRLEANSLDPPTSPSMFQAVLDERKSKLEGLWWDQACINQDDEEEKAVSVGAMDVIYTSARVVVVALDDLEISEAEVSLLESYIPAYEKSDDPPWDTTKDLLDSNSLAILSDLVKKILTSEYFERAWCDHELRLSRNAVFLIRCSHGSQVDERTTFLRFSGAFFVHMIFLVLSGSKAGWGDFEMHLGYLTNSFTQWTWGWLKRVAQQMREYELRVEELQKGSDVLASLKELEDLGKAIGRAALGSSSERTPSWASRRENFMTSMERVFAQKAGGNPRLPAGEMRDYDANRDKATIVLNTTGCGLALRPSHPIEHRYAALNAILRQKLLLLALAARDPLVLCFEGEVLSLAPNTVSWLHWPCKDSMNSTVVPPLPADAPIAVDPSSSCEYVQLDLLVLSSGQQSYHFPSMRYLELASSFFEEFVDHEEVWTVSRAFDAILAQRYRSEKDLHISLLACILECGVEWLASVGEATPANTRKLGIKESVEKVRLAIKTIFGDQVDRQPRPREDGVDGRTLEAAGVIFHFQLLLTTFILQRTFDNRRWDSYAAIWFEISSGRVLTIIPARSLIHLSVPVVLTADHYHDLPRCWVLQKDQDTSWSILAKVRLFGGRHILEGDVSDADQFWVTRRKQKVYQYIDRS